MNEANSNPEKMNAGEDEKDSFVEWPEWTAKTMERIAGKFGMELREGWMVETFTEEMYKWAMMEIFRGFRDAGKNMPTFAARLARKDGLWKLQIGGE